jgi:hypothetical protein
MLKLEKYLRASGDDNIIRMLDDGAEEGQVFYSGSGNIFKWVSILRAADIHWSPLGANDASVALFRLREEGVMGNSPHIVVKCSNR